MKKIIILLLLISFVIGSCCFFPGCGENKKESEELQSIIEQSNEELQKVKTFNIDFKSTLDAPVISKEKEKLNMLMSADIEDKDNPRYHIKFSGMGTDSEAYSIGDYAYAFVPEKGWLKSLTTEVRDLMDVFQLSPSELENLTASARNLELKEETEDSYVIAFEVGPEFFKEAMLNRDVADELGPEVKYMVDEMSERTQVNAVLTVDKETMLVSRVELEMDVENVELLGDISFIFEAEFTGYNEPLDIDLPEEAAGARETDSAEIMEILQNLPI